VLGDVVASLVALLNLVSATDGRNGHSETADHSVSRLRAAVPKFHPKTPFGRQYFMRSPVV
jgi:hypothetical protein